MSEGKVACRSPNPGKKPKRIDRWKFDAVRRAILEVLPTEGEGIVFMSEEFHDAVAAGLTPEEREYLGSAGWYTTTVKLELEVRGEIRRVPGSKPQRLLCN